jgi:hypothetical protein
MSSTISLFQVIQWAQVHIRMSPLIGAGGVVNEPALSICNDTLQTLLSSPYDWKFNKGAILPFTTIPYQQDYVLSGCQMTVKSGTTNVCTVHLNSAISANGPGLSQSGNVVTALFSDFAPNGTFGLNGPPGSQPVTSGTSIPTPGQTVTIVGALQSAYNVTNAVITGQVIGTNGGVLGVTFNVATTGLANDGGQGIGDLNWVSHCTLQDYMNTATVRPLHDIEVVSTLYLESIIQPPFKVCMLLENTPTAVPVILNDPVGNFWLLGVTTSGQITITETNIVGSPFYLLNDAVVANSTWKLSVNALGQLVTTSTTYSPNPQILFVSANNPIIISSGILETIGSPLGQSFGTTLTFRFWPVPSTQIWQAFIFYQLKAPILTSLSQTWAPWPDNLGYALRSNALAAVYQFFEDPRYPTAFAKAQADTLRCLDLKDQELRSESYFPDLPLLRGG